MSSSTATPAPLDTREMAVVHSFFRRELRLAGGVVRAVAPGDTPRSAVVADHLAFVTGVLHSHHTGEDELVWPLLLERVPGELAPLVHLMETQHENVDRLLGVAAGLRERWRESAAVAERDALAAVLDELYVALVEHLDAEEQRVLPLAARCLTQAEWDALGERGAKETPPRLMPLVLGMFAYEGDPEVVAAIQRKAPPVLRWFIPGMARRAFRRYAVTIHGTPTP